MFVGAFNLVMDIYWFSVWGSFYRETSSVVAGSGRIGDGGDVGVEFREDFMEGNSAGG